MNFINRLKIRNKLILMLILPIGCLLYFSLNGMWEKTVQADAMNDLKNLTRLSVKISNLVHELQRERGSTALFIGSKGAAFVTELSEQRFETDKKISELQTFLHGFKAERFGPEFKKAVDNAISSLDEIKTKRSSASSMTAGAGEIIGYYTNMISQFLEAVSFMTKISGNAELSTMATAYVNFLWDKENSGIERATLSNTFAMDNFGPGMFKRFTSVVTAQEIYLNVFLSLAASDQRDFYKSKLQGQFVDEVERMRGLAFEKASAGKFGIDPAYWFKMKTGQIKLLREVEDKLNIDLEKKAEEIHAQAQKTFVFYIALSIIAILAAVILAYVVIRNITKPIEAVLSVTTEISKGDLTRIVTTPSKDEMGQLVGSIEAMRKGLVELIHHVRDSMKKVKLSVSGFVTGMNKLTEGSEKQVVDSAEITTSVLEINTTTGEITEAVKHLHESAEGTLTTLLEMKASVKEVAENTSSFASFIDETSSSIEESFASIKAINENIEHSRKSVSNTLVSATQITASVNEVRDSAKQSSLLAKEVTSTIREKGISSIHESVKSINEIKDSADDTAKIVKGMRKSSEKIDEIAQVIAEVADETKLLALNAAILSAQAGEHGKGFGVVADEIGRLAERTAKNTKEITAIIEEVKGSINNVATAEKKTVTLIEQGLELITDVGVVFNGILETSTASASQTAFIEKATTEQAKAIKEINSSIEGISSRMEEILNASEQQRSGSEMILAGIEKAKEIAQGLKNSTSEQSKGADLITRSGEDILSRVSRIKKAMEDMKAGSKAITKRIEAITDIAKDNLGLAKEMTKESSLLGDSVGTLDGEINRFRS
ncbi:MAG: methyl-accepting chemotaxis protein [Nitrospirae bacterium]|nr:methyl-accepting chemotaxis protein [Nitrospirota bacterium]MBI3376796.1 methyl-accepting chemotaxis protein [Nitrospirota bacterium]